MFSPARRSGGIGLLLEEAAVGAEFGVARLEPFGGSLGAQLLQIGDEMLPQRRRHPR